jgi:hypothetical protein
MSKISRRTVRKYLVKTASTEPTYLRAREITGGLNGSPKAVAQYLSHLQYGLSNVSREQWGHSQSTTWRLEVTDS